MLNGLLQSERQFFGFQESFFSSKKRLRRNESGEKRERERERERGREREGEREIMWSTQNDV